MTIHELIEAIKSYRPQATPHHVPAWGRSVYVKPLTTEQYLSLNDDIPFHVQVVLAGVCDEHGQPLFTREHVPVLMSAVAGPVVELSDAVIKATKGITDEDAKN